MFYELRNSFDLIEMYKVSILVPIFKAERYIEKCVNSLFEQTYSNLEFVFVNDCTPDKSIELLEKELENYPNRFGQTKIIHNEQNLGAAASKNIAIDHATGLFVCFVDADDWMELNAIELLIRDYMETGCDVIWGRMALHTKEGTSVMEEPEYPDKQQWVNSYIRENGGGALLSNSRRIIRRDLIESNKIRMKEGYNYSEDRLFMIQVAYYAQSFSTIKDTIYHYNKLNDESQTEIIVEEKGLIERYKQILGNYQLVEDFFLNKEKEYYAEAVKTKLTVLKEVMDMALRYPSRVLFYNVVKKINETDRKFWYIIGWDKSNSWRCRHSNYFYRRVLPIVRGFCKRIIN